jgi:hypothetical protein
MNQNIYLERCNRFARVVPLGFLCACAVHSAAAGEAYRPITATLANRTITLTGHDLTIEQVVDVARHGAKVTISEEAMQRALPLQSPGRLGPRNCNDDRRSGHRGEHGQAGRSS